MVTNFTLMQLQLCHCCEYVKPPVVVMVTMMEMVMKIKVVVTAVVVVVKTLRKIQCTARENEMELMAGDILNTSKDRNLNNVSMLEFFIFPLKMVSLSFRNFFNRMKNSHSEGKSVFRRKIFIL